MASAASAAQSAEPVREAVNAHRRPVEKLDRPIGSIVNGDWSILPKSGCSYSVSPEGFPGALISACLFRSDVCLVAPPGVKALINCASTVSGQTKRPVLVYRSMVIRAAAEKVVELNKLAFRRSF